MISFACQNINLKDIITCSFDLRKTDYETLVYLLQQDEPLPIAAIAMNRKLERSTVQKSISRLLKKDLIERAQVNLKNGGYSYIYKVSNKNKIKKELKDIVGKWFDNVIDAITDW